MSQATIQKHLTRLKKLVQRKKNNGVLPSQRSLEKLGFWHSYDVVRTAGLLGQFKRRKLSKKRK